ncbi:MAG: SlyX family protein [Acidimicrobiia bacterium]|nr:SlyX family protein [Acidimicrobiia bacterium]MYC57643.1 SlyX family protein [Acidimicrobiia bacterium]MYG94443.1 SlyX family protein [Acidimicrobiia bacterium]MYI30704.1 SlyX family protein [Acidimicrobiia bacterium]
MSVEVVTQILTLMVAVLAIIWHQQRTTDKLRDIVIENRQRIARIEAQIEHILDMLAELKKEVIRNGQRIARLEERVGRLEQRMARVEGVLTIDIPANTAAELAPIEPPMDPEGAVG